MIDDLGVYRDAVLGLQRSKRHRIKKNGCLREFSEVPKGHFSGFRN